MKSLLALFFLLELGLLPVLAQIPGPPSYTVNGPFPYTPLPNGQYGLAVTSATSLTVPNLATYAVICAETATVRYTTDGHTTPSASVGMPLLSGTCVGVAGPKVLANFKALSSTGTLDIEYFK